MKKLSDLKGGEVAAGFISEGSCLDPPCWGDAVSISCVNAVN